MKSGPIIIIEDDADDKSILQEVLEEIGVTNELIWFVNCNDAFTFLVGTKLQPFLILSDVSLPGKNGIEMKRQIDGNAELRRKCIPFIFYSTSVQQKTVNDAYTQMTVQGFFQKKDSYDEIKKNIKLIVDYWQECRHPNT